MLVSAFLSDAELAAAQRNVSRYAPSSEEIDEAPERYATLLRNPELLQWDFPFSGEDLNDVSTHPDLIEFVERILGSSNILMSQAVLWAKYGGTANFDQELHLDYDENTLVYPRADSDYDQVLAIIYYTDITEVMGPTFIVPWDENEPHGPRSMWPNYRSRTLFATLYEREKPVLCKAGSLVVMSIRTFHRGSGITAKRGARFTHHLAFQSNRHPWMGRYRQWPRYGTAQAMRSFLTRASPRQRSVIGFPPPGDAYWTHETLAGVQERYPGIDMSAYRTFE